MAAYPAKIGKYTVESVIGRGGMGVVYKAVDPQIGRYVAIKMINSGGDPSLLERFRAEARSTGSLQFPNIVTVYDFGEQDGNPYLVMQFLEGPSLESIIQQGVSLALPEKLGIIIDVCNGLAYAHQRGVIHRDIKPANIIVLEDGVNDGMGVIVDFGIARIGGDVRLTKTDQIVGSFHYMSAEQLQAQELDNRGDIYAAGVVLFQLLTDALPFYAPDTAATLLQIINEPPPPLSKYLKEYPEELEAILNRALAKRREDRYANARDFASDLMRVQENVKSDTVLQLVRRAEGSFTREEWTRAREYLQQVLRIDRQNIQAQRLMNAVEERLRQQQQLEQARGLRSQADEAYMDQRYDDALRLLDQAVGLDATNSNLVTFRDSVRVDKERAMGLRRALRRAEVALQDGDLDEAESAVDEAFKIDPHDTQAKALKVIISQQNQEKIRLEQVRALLDQARNQIVGRDLPGAFATLKTAEALDPASSELQSVAKMAVGAREQEKRRSETEELRRQVETALVNEEYATAVAKAEEGLQRFPQEQSLLKLKALAEAQRVRVEHKKFVREQFSAASSLADSGDLVHALAALDSALERTSGNSELESLRATVKERFAAEESKRQRLAAAEATLAEGKRILQQRGARSAREFLDKQVSHLAEFPLLSELHEAARAREALDDLDSRLAAEVNPARRVQLGEVALRSNPDNPWIQQRLADLQRVRAEITAAIDRAQAFEAAKRFADALHEWQKLQAAYPQVPEFGAQIRQLANLQEEGKKSATVQPIPPVVVPHAALETTKPTRLDANFSATRVRGTGALQDSPVTPKESPATIRKDAEAPAAKKIALMPTVDGVPQKRFPRGDKTSVRKLFVVPNQYMIVAAAALVLAVAGYLLFGRHGNTHNTVTITPLQIHIVTNPSDALVTKDSNPVLNGTLALTPGTSVAIEVARLGYKTKRVELRQASDGNIVLEPEPMHLSIQTSEKSGTVELDGQKIGDLSGGSMDEYDLVPDGNAHKLSVMVRGKQLFAVTLRAVVGSPPQVDAFDTSGLFLITSLGTNAKLYAGTFLKSVRIGDQNVSVTSSGADMTLNESHSEIKFGEGSEQGSLTLEISNAPILAVHSTNVDGQVLVTTNVEGAQLTVERVPVQRQRHGWQVSRPPGTYNFALSAEGYEPQKWTMTLQRRQMFAKNVELKPKVVTATMASLSIVGGTPGAEVNVDGQRVGELDANGNVQLPAILTIGPHSIAFAKPYHESRTFEVAAKLPDVRLADVNLIAWPSLSFQSTANNVTVMYHRVGDSQEHQATASARLRLPTGQYELEAEAAGFQKYSAEVKLAAGDDVSLPLKLVPIQDYEFQDPTQVVHEGPWIKLKDTHKFVYLKPGLLSENLIFSKPGKNLFWNRKIEWQIEAVDGSVRLQYILEGQKMLRRLVTGGETSDQKEEKVDATAGAQPTSLSVHIEVNETHVRVSNDKGAVLDDYATSLHNFSASRIGVRTDSRFVVRSN